LILNLWSFAGDEDRANVNAMTLQPFFNYNLPKGWYLTSSPLITADWEADDDNRWTLLIGGGSGASSKRSRFPPYGGLVLIMLQCTKLLDIIVRRNISRPSNQFGP
jgi:hypothetical protein